MRKAVQANLMTRSLKALKVFFIYYVCLVFADILAIWKPSIQYYDYYVQSSSDDVVKQIFPYVKVRFFTYFFLFDMLPN